MADANVDIQELYELAGYVNSIGKRSESLAKAVVGQDAYLDLLDAKLKSARKSAFRDMNELKDDVGRIKAGVKELQGTIMLMIIELKSTLKKDEFERFSRRVDAWAPESLVPRKEARRLIQEIKVRK